MKIYIPLTSTFINKIPIMYEYNFYYVSVEQIRQKWQNLCDGFFTATTKIENKETLSYLENSLLERLIILSKIIYNI